jgi:CHAT domain-containing protein/tetratricopeptide (TPR) repeat protein
MRRRSGFQALLTCGKICVMRIIRLGSALICLVAATALAGQTRSPADTVRAWYAAKVAGSDTTALSLHDPAATFTTRRAVIDDVDRYCMELESLRIAREEIDGDRARVESIAHIRRRPLGHGRMREEIERRSFELTRSGEQWLIRNAAYREDELIDEIAKNRGRAHAIVAANAHLVSERFVEQLIARSLLEGHASNDGHPVRWFGDLALDIASDIGDRGGIAAAMAIQAESEQRAPGADRTPHRRPLEEAVRIAEEAEAYDAMALAANALAVTMLSLEGPSAEAEKLFQRVLQYRKSIVISRISSLTSNYGLLLFQRGDYAAAYRTFQDALVVSEREGAEVSIQFVELHLGWILERQNDYELASHHFRRATELNAPKPFRIMAHLGYARTFLARGMHDAARAETDRAFQIARDTPYKGLISQCRALLARLALDRGDLAGAEAMLREAVAYARDVKYRVAEVEALIALGNLYLRTGRTEEALQAARDAAPRTGGGEFGTWDSHAAFMLAARVDLARGNTDAAIAHLHRAIEATETARTTVAGNERQRVLFFEPRHAAYTEMARLLALRGDAAEALLYSERAKARVLLDALGQQNTADALLAEPDRKTRETLIARLHEVNQRALLLRVDEKASRAALEEVAAERARAQLALEAFHNDLEARDPRLVGHRATPALIDMASIRSALQSTDAAFLEYLVHDDFTTLFVIDADTVTAHRLEVSRPELTRRVAAYSAQLEQRNLRYGNAARALYDLLLAPAEAKLRGKQVLGIVPDGPLWKLPFASLRDAKDRHLLERAALFYVPSISAHREIGRRQLNAAPDAQKPVVVFGNPVITATMSSKPAFLRAAELGPLPDAEHEAEQIARLWGSGSSLYVREAATEAAVKRELTRSRLVHLAAHAIFDDNNPMFSELILVPDKESGEDGVLQPWELMRLNMTADLVVLSACETGRGRLNAGEGPVGMSWALFLGGCPSTVVAQWKIGADTAPLMIAFHRALATTPAPSHHKAHALREAQLQTLRRRATAHPFYWAAFALMGAPE